MQPEQIRSLLEEVQTGVRSIDQAFAQLAELPFSDIGDAKLDNHRALRCGFAEVVLCSGKDPRDVVRILEEGLRSTPCMLATRAEKRHIDVVREHFPAAIINPRGRTVRVGSAVSMKARGTVMVVTAGTSDIPVAEEALETLRAFGCEGWHCYDVGVAGLHRVLAELPMLRKAAAIICIAGMEGALPSVIGGLVACPVIAVPSSVGYGASFNGVAALLGMLNTCAAGVTVVNIDNGFGAAMSALRMIADRDYPIVEVPVQAAPSASPDELAAVQSSARDEQLLRLEKAVEQLASLAQRPVVVESPTIEINHPNQDEQTARLERGIAELAGLVAKQELSQGRNGDKQHGHHELLSRLEQAIGNITTILSRPVVVESPKIEISHPGQDEQIARLERAIGELASVSSSQREILEQTRQSRAAPHPELSGTRSSEMSAAQTETADTAHLSSSHDKHPPDEPLKTSIVKDEARGKKAAGQPRKNKKSKARAATIEQGEQP
jgi:NCAIR mutase (PurE)-related protein